MIIEINEHTLLSEIRRSFKSEFPYLDIAFFEKPHQTGAANAKAMMLEYNLTAGVAGDAHKTGSLLFEKNQTIAEIEKHFEAQFGLHVQILRKSGGVYLQTTTSDGVSLSALNEDAKIAAEFKPDESEPEDYHEQL